MNYSPYQYYQPQYNQNQYYQPMQSQQMYQPQMQSQQSNTLNGRIVDDIASVSANEVPMSGDIAVFVKNDKSEIYIKQWKSDGTISTKTYKPISDDKQSNASNSIADTTKFVYEPSDAFRDALNERFDKLEKLIAPKKTTKRENDAE